MNKNKANNNTGYKVKVHRTNTSKIKIGELGLELIVKPKIKNV